MVFEGGRSRLSVDRGGSKPLGRRSEHVRRKHCESITAVHVHTQSVAILAQALFLSELGPAANRALHIGAPHSGARLGTIPSASNTVRRASFRSRGRAAVAAVLSDCPPTLAPTRPTFGRSRRPTLSSRTWPNSARIGRSRAESPLPEQLLDNCWATLELAGFARGHLPRRIAGNLSAAFRSLPTSEDWAVAAVSPARPHAGHHVLSQDGQHLDAMLAASLSTSVQTCWDSL